MFVPTVLGLGAFAVAWKAYDAGQSATLLEKDARNYPAPLQLSSATAARTSADHWTYAAVAVVGLAAFYAGRDTR